MPDIVLAIAKALAGVPGLGPVFNPLIALREEEKAKANASLLAKIEQDTAFSRDSVDLIVRELLQFRHESREHHQQVVQGFCAALDIMRAQGSPLLIAQLLSGNVPPQIDQDVAALLQANTPILPTYGLLTREVLRDELVRLFSDDVRTLLALAQPAGFPKGFVSTNITPIQAYYDFLEVCDGLPPRDVARIADAVAKKKPGSAILRSWCELHASSSVASEGSVP